MLAIVCSVLVVVSISPAVVALSGPTTIAVDDDAPAVTSNEDDGIAGLTDVNDAAGPGHRLALAAELQPILEDARSDRAAALAVAERAVAARAGPNPGDDAMEAPVGVELTNLRGAREILAITDDAGRTGRLPLATRLTRAGFELQAAQTGAGDGSVGSVGSLGSARSPGSTASTVEALPETPTPDHPTPSAAAFAVLERQGATPTAEQARTIRSLDDIPEPTRSELTDIIDAYLGYRAATAAAYADVDWSAVQEEPDPSANTAEIRATLANIAGVPETSPSGARLRALASEAGSDGQRPGSTGIDVARVRAAQLELLRATADLRSSVDAADQTGAATPADHAPAGGVRVPGVLAIDVSTHDNIYTNNYTVQIDVGGDDIYNNNAGGAVGNGAPPTNEFDPDAAALIDLAGEDAYHGRNGGGDDVAVGFLVDAGIGDDEYNANSGDFDLNGHGVNGGGNLASIGFLLDTGGEDSYEGGQKGVNGGGHNLGSGFLLDTGRGEDTYRAGDNGTNGGGRGLGRGFLVDTGGEDTYVGGDRGVNGGGRDGGLGFLIDAGVGEDTYGGGFGGSNGGAGFDSTGGFLLDDGGDDTYLAGAEGTNGGNLGAGIGFLIDVGPGEDTFEAGFGATNGGGVLDAGGYLLNVGTGDDTYDADSGGTNGGGFAVGVGLLLDTAGDDTYEGTHTGTNGGGAVFPLVFQNVTLPLVSASLLVDAQGDDFYNDTNVTCVDCTRIPKGTFGAQVDADDPSGSAPSGTPTEDGAEKGRNDERNDGRNDGGNNGQG